MLACVWGRATPQILMQLLLTWTECSRDGVPSSVLGIGRHFERKGREKMEINNLFNLIVALK